MSRWLLNSYLGYSMRDICPHGLDARNNNHCAHFVSHFLQLSFGCTCASLKGRGSSYGAANVRVHEIFEKCPTTTELRMCPTVGQGLIFVSKHTNFSGTPVRMRNIPKKHVGLLLNGIVWHYSNLRNKVITQTVSDFLFHYSRQRNSLWIGTFLSSAVATTFGTSGVAV